jgi:plastocyanin
MPFLQVGGGALLLFLSSTTCGGAPETGPDVELREALGLESDEELHRIVLGGQGRREHLVPTRLEIPQGAIVEIVTVDRRVHTVTFLRDSLSSEAAAFLTETNQMQSPPLLEQGSRFVISFRGAPPGRYPFVSEGHGGTASGIIVVEGN